MSETGYLKCPCRVCGGNIEFPAQGIGRTVSCPHCGEKTLLGRASAGGGTSFTPRPAAAPETQASVSEAGQSAPAGRSKVVPILAAILGLGAAAAGIWWWLQRETPTPPPSQPASLSGKMAALEGSQAPPTAAVSPKTPGPARPKSLEDLKAGPVTLDKARSGNLIYATGTLRNDSDHARYGVRIEIGLTDANGRSLRNATDYKDVLEPRQEWRFRALVLESKATAAKVSSITEDP
ncbi:MAG: hypothetical protein RJA22_1574 [Verrucomicrobiota bacterium]|jgi:hypothetical protein